MTKTKKITARVPVDSLRRAQFATGQGVSETVRRGLDPLASSAAADELRRFRGKAHLDLGLQALRQDRQ